MVTASDTFVADVVCIRSEFHWLYSMLCLSRKPSATLRMVNLTVFIVQGPFSRLAPAPPFSPLPSKGYCWWEGARVGAAWPLRNHRRHGGD